MTVEAFETELDANQIATQATKIAADLGIKVALQPVGLFPERRYVLITTDDRERFDKIDSTAMASGAITGGWHGYGRDQRMAHILGSMKQMGAL